MTLSDTLLSVFRQSLVDGSPTVHLDSAQFKVIKTSRHKLRQVDFEFEGRRLRGLEQNPNTASRWAQLARKGKDVMQFLEAQRYFAVIVDSHITWYGKRSGDTSDEKKS